MIVDACRDAKGVVPSGLSTRGNGSSALISPNSVPDTVALLQSCSAGQVAYEPSRDEGDADFSKNAFFTQALLEGLVDANNPAARDGVVSFAGLLDYVVQRTQAIAKENGVEQKPTYKMKTEFFALLNVRDEGESATTDDSGATVAGGVGNTGAKPNDVDGSKRKAGDRAELKIQTDLIDKPITVAFRYCPAGTFVMGSPQFEKNREKGERQHNVTLTKGFWMGETEMTQELWKAVTGENPSSNSNGENLPVENITYMELQAVVQALNDGGFAPKGWMFSLPTEAQWEYACRAGTRTPTYGKLDEIAWYGGNSGSKTHPVGKKTPNAWGFYDMHGNVDEWCQDVLGKYPTTAVTDPIGPKEGEGYKFNGDTWTYDETGGSWRVLRGGNCTSHEASDCRAAYRAVGKAFLYHMVSDPCFPVLGGRLALVPAH